MNRNLAGAGWVAGLAGLVLAGAGQAIAGGDAAAGSPKSSREFTRAAEEREKGRAMFDAYLGGETLWEGGRVNEYVNRLGQNMARAAGAPGPFVFRVVRSPEPNAQAFPGGFVAVNAGIIVLAESEAELAAVLAHEIAHVRARHWQRQSNRLGWISLLATAPLMIGASPVVWLAFYGAAVSAPWTRARFSRSFEMEADRLALEYLAASGYDPGAALTVLARYQAAELRQGRGRCGWLSSHPDVARRLTGAKAHLRQLAAPKVAREASPEFDSLRDEVLRPLQAAPQRGEGSRPDPEPPPPLLRRQTAEPGTEEGWEPEQAPDAGSP